MEANYQSVDIGLLTRELASTFCSAVHRAGLLYIVNCPSIDDQVYVDRDMWESVLRSLVDAKFLGRFEDDLYARL